MKASCPAVLASFVKVQLDMRVVTDDVRYTVDPGLETKVQLIAVIVAVLL